VESFIQEMRRYLGLGEEDCARLRELGPRLEKYFPEMSERFYSQIPRHPQAYRVFTGGEAQIARLKQTLQHWAQGLFSGLYDQVYADDRYQIGYRHVRIGLDQKYVISAMGIVRAYFSDCLLLEFPATDARLHHAHSLGKILDLDLNLMCESYMHATLQNLRAVNEQLEGANRELAEASRVKDDFLAHTSHELRTPLNSIMGFTRLILDGLCKTREEEQELLQDVFRSAQHLLGIVNDILDIAKMEANQMTLVLEEINPRQLLDSTLPLVAVQAASKGLELRDETIKLRMPKIRGDQVRLRQVLLNVLSNAVKFTSLGTVTLRAEIPKPEGRNPGEAAFLRFEVEDTGIGISLENRAAVFGKFVQVDNPLTRRQGGTGLGLAITRRLVEMMGGQIGLREGAGGAGTLVWFTLPIVPGIPRETKGREREPRAAEGSLP